MFSPDGRTVASGSGDETVRIWNAATGECLQTLQASDPVPCVFIGTIEGRDCFDFADSAQVVGVPMDGASQLQFSNGGECGGAPACSGAVAWHGNSVHFLVRRGGNDILDVSGLLDASMSLDCSGPRTLSTPGGAPGRPAIGYGSITGASATRTQSDHYPVQKGMHGQNLRKLESQEWPQAAHSGRGLVSAEAPLLPPSKGRYGDAEKCLCCAVQ